MKKESFASIKVMLTGALWGLIGLFTRKLSELGYDSMQITMLRTLETAVLVFLYLAIFDRKKLKIELKDIWMFICTGLVCIFVHNITFFYAIINGEASIACILVNTSPIWIMLVSALVFKEKITKRKLAALALVFIGYLCVSGIFGSSQKTSVKILLIGLLSGFSYGMYSIFTKIAIRKYSSETITLYTFIFAFSGTLFITDVHGLTKIMMHDAYSFFLPVAFCVVCCVVPFLLYSSSLKELDASKAGIMVATDPMVGTTLGFLVLGDEFTYVKLAGIVLVFVSILLLNVSKKTGEK